MKHLPTIALLPLLLLAAACAPGARPDEPAAAPAPPAAEPRGLAPVLREPAVVGASLSAGFGVRAPGRGLVDLGEVLAAALAPPPDAVHAASSAMFFLDPDGAGARLVERALAAEPTLAVAVDFLFWFAYGVRTDERRHRERFERGLALLDRLPCPILVGDLPDVRHATEAPVRMIVPAQVPDPDVLAALNARLAEWAAARPRVHVVPLAGFVRSVIAGDPVEVRGNRWSAAERLLQVDRLHPTLEGTVGVALLALDVLERADPGVTPAMVRWDAERVLVELRGGTAAARGDEAAPGAPGLRSR